MSTNKQIVTVSDPRGINVYQAIGDSRLIKDLKSKGVPVERDSYGNHSILFEDGDQSNWSWLRSYLNERAEIVSSKPSSNKTKD